MSNNKNQNNNNRNNYKNNNYQDNSGYQVEVNINYVTDYDYPKEVTLTLIHEENKLVIVEIK